MNNIRRASIAPWIVIAVIIVVLDQTTKQIVLARMTPGESVPVLPFFNIVLAFNTGAAFSFLADAGGWQRVFFVGISVVAIVAILYWLKQHAHERLFCLGLALILGGAIGNLYDRVMLGKVVDFLLVHDYIPFQLPSMLGWLDPFPAFNVADSGITIGAGLIILDSLFGRKTTSNLH